jgi:hypothetical protein
MNKDMSIALEEIKTEHAKVAELIAKFEAQSRTLSFSAQTICLAPGEEYAGVILGKDGEQSHYLILLPGDKENISWHDANKWAVSIGGSLPTRREQALLYSNLKEQFECTYYWSSEEHASDSDYAWCQYFNLGYQTLTTKSSELRARAVRRLTIL